MRASILTLNYDRFGDLDEQLISNTFGSLFFLISFEANWKPGPILALDDGYIPLSYLSFACYCLDASVRKQMQ